MAKKKKGWIDRYCNWLIKNDIIKFPNILGIILLIPILMIVFWYELTGK